MRIMAHLINRPGDADMTLMRGIALIFILAWGLGSAAAADSRVIVQWLGQAAFRITTPGGKVIVVDPFLTQNPRTLAEYKNLARLGKVDLILVSHAHADHVGDAPELAKLHQATVYAPVGLNDTLTALGLLPRELAGRFNKSGTITPLGPGIRITMVRAEHSSEFRWTDPQTGRPQVHVGGEPAGFIIELENGFRIYHMGDTGLFGDLGLIGRYYKPDLVLIPIGGNFTMDPRDAAYAVNEFLKPGHAIPMHYGTNPLLKGTPEEFRAALGQSATRVHVLMPGEAVSF